MDESLANLADGEPEAVLVAVAKVFQQMPSDAGAAGVIEIAERIAVKENVNVLRLMREHPGLSLELLGVDPDFSDGAVQRFDELAEAE